MYKGRGEGGKQPGKKYPYEETIYIYIYRYTHGLFYVRD